MDYLLKIIYKQKTIMKMRRLVQMKNLLMKIVMEKNCLILMKLIN